MPRSLDSLRRSYDARRKRRQPTHAGIRMPLTDRRERAHDDARFTASDASLLYAGPLVVCLRHCTRIAPSKCSVRRANTYRWPGAPLAYDVWRPVGCAAEPFLLPPPYVEDMLLATGDASAFLQQHPLQYLDAERRELPLLGAVGGTPIDQVEVVVNHTTVALSNRGALALQSRENDDGDRCGAADECEPGTDAGEEGRVDGCNEQQCDTEQAYTAEHGEHLSNDHHHHHHSACIPALYHRFGVTAPNLAANEYCVYVIESPSSPADSNGYIGIAPLADKEQRLREHNGDAAGGAQATAIGRPWRAVRSRRGYATRLAAERAEARAHRLLPNGGPCGPLAACLAALDASE